MVPVPISQSGGVCNARGCCRSVVCARPWSARGCARPRILWRVAGGIADASLQQLLLLLPMPLLQLLMPLLLMLMLMLQLLLLLMLLKKQTS